MRRAALLALLLAGGCAGADMNKGFLDSERPAKTSAAHDTGSCKPWFVSPSRDWGDGASKHSCWNLVWEIPTALVVVPLALGVITAPVWVPIVLIH